MTRDIFKTILLLLALLCFIFAISSCGEVPRSTHPAQQDIDTPKFSMPQAIRVIPGNDWPRWISGDSIIVNGFGALSMDNSNGKQVILTDTSVLRWLVSVLPDSFALSGYADTLRLSNDTLYISGQNYVLLSDYLDNTDAQTLSLITNTLAITGGNSVDLSAYLDNTDAQTLSFSNPNLSISGGNSVDLSALSGGGGGVDFGKNIVTSDGYVIDVSMLTDQQRGDTLQWTLDNVKDTAWIMVPPYRYKGPITFQNRVTTLQGWGKSEATIYSDDSHAFIVDYTTSNYRSTVRNLQFRTEVSSPGVNYDAIHINGHPAANTGNFQMENCHVSQADRDALHIEDSITLSYFDLKITGAAAGSEIGRYTVYINAPDILVEMETGADAVFYFDTASVRSIILNKGATGGYTVTDLGTNNEYVDMIKVNQRLAEGNIAIDGDRTIDQQANSINFAGTGQVRMNSASSLGAYKLQVAGQVYSTLGYYFAHGRPLMSFKSNGTTPFELIKVIDGTNNIRIGQLDMDHTTIYGGSFKHPTSGDYVNIFVGNESVTTWRNGQVKIGTDQTMTTSAKLEISGTDGALLLPRLTTAQRDALTPSAGMAIFNTSVDSMQYRTSTGWRNF